MPVTFDLSEADGIEKTSHRMWEIVTKHNPEMSKAILNAIADDRLERPELAYANFLFGASYALMQMQEGNIREMHKGLDDQTYSKIAEEANRLSNENDRLKEWINLLEAFVTTTTAHFMRNSNWWKLKRQLLAKWPDFLKPNEKLFG